MVLSLVLTLILILIVKLILMRMLMVILMLMLILIILVFKLIIIIIIILIFILVLSRWTPSPCLPRLYVAEFPTVEKNTKRFELVIIRNQGFFIRHMKTRLNTRGLWKITQCTVYSIGWEARGNFKTSSGYNEAILITVGEYNKYSGATVKVEGYHQYTRSYHQYSWIQLGN